MAQTSPTVTITEDTNNDGVISRTEISGTVGVNVGLPSGAKVGDILTVSGQPSMILTAANISACSLRFEFARPADGVTLTVTATLTNAAGITSPAGRDSACMGDTTATLAPTVSIAEDTNNDGIISRTEISGTVGVNVGIPAGARVGDTLAVSGQASVVMTAATIAAGTLHFEYARPADGATLTVTATLTDVAGNASPAGTDSARMGDTTATVAPTVTIAEDTNNDGIISRTEISGTVGVNVGIPAGAQVGDTLAVSGQASVVLNAVNISAGTLHFEYARPADGATLTVTATLTDVAGNASPAGTDSARMGDTTATVAPTVTIAEDTNNDGTISAAEINGTVGVNVGIPTGAQVGDTLTVSGQPAVVLNAINLAAGTLHFEYDRPADGATLNVTATLTDVAGNVSPTGSDSATMGDTTATLAPTVSIAEDTNNDGTISRTELNGMVGVNVGIPAGAQVGDTLTVSGQPVVVLNAINLAAGTLHFEFATPANGATLTVTATLTDVAGNVSAVGSDSAILDLASHVAITGVVVASAFENLSIYAGSYLSTGADSVVNGGIMTGGYTSIGAGGKLDGNIFAGGYISTGASAVVSGDALSGGYVTTGALSTISGAIAAVAAITPLAGAAQELLAAATMAGQQSDALARVVDAQHSLNAMGSGTSLAAVLDTTTLVAGVYSAASLSTVAGATLTLDGQGLANQTWIFNIADILALGANTKIDLVNVGENASVVWNSNGYASIGADAQVVGTILAQNYISVGANTIITGPNGTNGGLFAQTDYITFGAGAHVGIAGNSSDTNANLVTGTAEANSLVTLYSEHSTLGTVTADGSGNFSYTLTTLNVSTLGVEANKIITASIVDTGLHTVTSTGFVYNDHLGGSFGNDALVGTTGNDTIHGGIGNDLLQGGAGNDLLFGGVGADVFKWSLLETGADVIKDFNLAPVASGGDVLDLKDLLVGESANAGSLQAYLHFSANSAGQTVISVDAHGGVPSAVEQTITLENIQYSALQTYAHGASDTAILAKLLGDGHLKTDI